MNRLLVKAEKYERRLIQCALSDYFVFRIPVTVVFFYQKIIPSSLIINSLQHVLTDFPIFSSVLIKRSNQLYIDCNNQGVNLSIVNSDDLLLNNTSALRTEKSNVFVRAINSASLNTPVLNIQLNYFKDGMTIGYCWHHSIGDMATFIEFLQALSNFAKGLSYELPLIVSNRDDYLGERKNKKETQLQDASRLKMLNIVDILRFIRQKYSARKSIYFYFTEDELSALKNSVTGQLKTQVTRNTSLCSHLLTVISQCREDNALMHYASIIINYRKRIGMPGNALGNYLDSLPLLFNSTDTTTTLANSINDKVNNYHQDSFNPMSVLDFINAHGEMKKINRFIPDELLPQRKNLIITNWSNFNIYSINFGISEPFLFLPVGEKPIPWVASISEGFHNRGAIVSLDLPYKIAENITQPYFLERIHQYRPKLSQEEMSILTDYSWFK